MLLSFEISKSFFLEHDELSTHCDTVCVEINETLVLSDCDTGDENTGLDNNGLCDTLLRGWKKSFILLTLESGNFSFLLVFPTHFKTCLVQLDKKMWSLLHERKHLLSHMLQMIHKDRLSLPTTSTLISNCSVSLSPTSLSMLCCLCHLTICWRIFATTLAWFTGWMKEETSSVELVDSDTGFDAKSKLDFFLFMLEAQLWIWMLEKGRFNFARDFTFLLLSSCLTSLIKLLTVRRWPGKNLKLPLTLKPRWKRTSSLNSFVINCSISSKVELLPVSISAIISSVSKPASIKLSAIYSGRLSFIISNALACSVWKLLRTSFLYNGFGFLVCGLYFTVSSRISSIL